MSNDYLLSGGTLIDGTGAAARPNDDLLICNGYIAGMGEIARRKAATHDDVIAIDCAGHTVMPGLVDGHVHLSFDEAASSDEFLFHRSREFNAIVAAWNAQKLLRAGVTSCLDADSLWGMGRAVRDAIEAGVVEGPRMVAGSEALITAPDPLGNDAFGPTRAPAHHRAVSGNDDIVAAVRGMAGDGSNWIKILASGPIPGQPDEQPLWTRAELRLACQTAHDLNIPVAAHCRHPRSIEWAAEAGVDVVVHATFMDERAREAVLSAGVAIMPTYTFLANFVDYGALVGAPAAIADVFRGEMEQSDRMLRSAHQDGVRFLTGSEAGFSLTPFGHWHARELELLVTRLGLSPLEAITAATGTGGDVIMRKPGELGVLGHGTPADVLVVDGDPLDDITVLQDRARLHHVFSRGREVDLRRPWPTRTVYRRERVGRLSRGVLTWQRARSGEEDELAVEDAALLDPSVTSCPCML